GGVIVGPVDASAGEHPAVRHEGMAAVPAAHQHARLGPVPADDHHGGGVLGTHGPRPGDAGRALGLSRFGRRFAHANNCMTWPAAVETLSLRKPRSGALVIARTMKSAAGTA